MAFATFAAIFFRVGTFNYDRWTLLNTFIRRKLMRFFDLLAS